MPQGKTKGARSRASQGSSQGRLGTGRSLQGQKGDCRGGEREGQRVAGRRGADRQGEKGRSQRDDQGVSPRGRRGARGRSAGPTDRGQRPPGDLIEGRRAVAEALDAGVELRRAFVQTGLDGPDSTLSQLLACLRNRGVPLEPVPRSRLDAMSSHGSHQGIIVQARPFAYATLFDIITAAGKGRALVMLLDHVADEGNLGAIVRSAEVVGATGVVIAKARAAGVGLGAYKSSAGAVLRLPVAQVANLATAIDRLKEAGFWVCGASEHAASDLWSAPLEGRLCLVMGSECLGLSRLVRERCDFECSLPQHGQVESLNVAQAATVLCYEWLRRAVAGQRGVPGTLSALSPAASAAAEDSARSLLPGAPNLGGRAAAITGAGGEDG